MVVLDKLTYAGTAFLEGVKHTFIEGDVCDPSAVAAAMADVDAVVHMAAESHVARSLHTPDHFLHTNIHGTRVMLDAALRAGIDRFIHISTDEVFGQAPHGVAFGPEAPTPRERLRRLKGRCRGAGACVETRTATPRPLSDAPTTWAASAPREGDSPIRAGLSGGPLPVHGEGTAIRDWLFVGDFARGIEAGLNRWQDQATWHFAGQQHQENRRMAGRINTLWVPAGRTDPTVRVRTHDTR